MYLRHITIENIRCVQRLQLAFEDGEAAGWHVLIGENGSGKTSVARAIAARLIAKSDADLLMIAWADWMKLGSDQGQISLEIVRDPLLDPAPTEFLLPGSFTLGYDFITQPNGLRMVMNGSRTQSDRLPDAAVFDRKGWFAAGFGPARRFRGTNSQFEDLEKTSPRAKALLSLFRDDVPFSEIEPWIQKLYVQEFEGKNAILKHLRMFMNHGDLLPNGVQMNGVSSEGVFFEDAEHNKIDLHELSDGYRSILSLTFELVRQLINCYGAAKVFENIERGDMRIPLPGVVIIDEIDAHLHPTWQARVGQWFTNYFPSIQFLVTTHSPLVCRACNTKGKIFRLASPHSLHASGEILGIERDRLVFGDILDAYATNIFGEDLERGEEGESLQAEYRELVYKERYGQEMTATEQERLDYLTQIFRFNVDHDRSRVG